jgi:hypothetical protein
MADPVTEYQTDHDLLVRLDERYASMHQDIKDMKTGTATRLDTLEKEVDSLKLWRSALVGAWGVCTLILIPLGFAYFTP